MSRGVRYLVVTPARNEAKTLRAVGERLLAQTVPMDRWIVVDDGSTDETARIARSFADRDRRVELLARAGAGGRAAGCGDIQTALVGLDSVPDLGAFDFIAKVDADVLLPPDYFEQLFDAFAADPVLGIAGGHCYERRADGALALDRVPDTHVRGATKVYRRECLEAIGVPEPVPGWDTIDELRARAAGWRVRSFLDPKAIHLRPVTFGDGRVLHGRLFTGRMCWYLGYRPDYALLRVLRTMGKRPFVLGGLAMAWGYLSAAAVSAERFPDEQVRALLRREQAERLRRMLPGRPRALATDAGVRGDG